MIKGLSKVALVVIAYAFCNFILFVVQFIPFILEPYTILKIDFIDFVTSTRLYFETLTLIMDIPFQKSNVCL